MKRIAILGSTGSIGTQALEVISANPDKFSIEVLTANNNANLLIEQAKKFVPNAVIISNKDKYPLIKAALSNYPIKVFAGQESIAQIVDLESIDLVLVALVGYAGLLPTINAIKAKKNIALANKETLVVAGELISKLVIENEVNIFPVDSEHSAIFQCLAGEYNNKIEKIILTASGGPFRNLSYEDLKKVKKDDALKHPNWNMGNKVTIDSSTLMNKGLEVIEARWLFNVKPEQIEVVIHPQSIIHSMIQFEDGSIKAQMGLPTMKLPILYAFSYPNRIKTNFERYDFTKHSTLTFEPPDLNKFKNLKLAYEAIEKGGNIPCALNAANEVAVHYFLKEQIEFLQIPEIISAILDKIDYIHNPNFEEYEYTDKLTRKLTEELIKI
jgi:1-deoxy-D-xylulose-5-phosphate reductoisomerase